MEFQESVFFLGRTNREGALLGNSRRRGCTNRGGRTNRGSTVLPEAEIGSKRFQKALQYRMDNTFSKDQIQVLCYIDTFLLHNFSRMKNV